MNNWEPWDEHPALTERRLVQLADIIRKVRGDVVALHAPDDGDSHWSLGCRAYSRICFAIREASKRLPWLRVLTGAPDALQFVFAIDGVPLKFYRGDPSDPPARHLEISHPELRQLQRALPGIEPPARGRTIFRLAVETNHRGEATIISLVKANEAGDILECHMILSASPSASITRIDTTRKQGVTLPPPTVAPIKKEEEKKDRDGKD